MNQGKGNRVNCYACKHFLITWEPRAPKACKLYGFKTTQLPSTAVFRSSGQRCMGFEEKDTKKK